MTLTAATTLSAKLVQKTIDYTDENGAALEGYVAYDDSITTPRPGIVVVHDWKGISATTKGRCDMLAGLGYVGFAADIYGKGDRPHSVPEYIKTMTPYKKDRASYRLRLRAALAELKKQPQVDPAKTAAIGYCFGGTGVIELARDGGDVLGVVSFHGGLDSPAPADGKNIKCKVLALCGADDPMESATDFAAFESELRDNHVDYQIVKYGGAEHAFTDPGSDAMNVPGVKYNEKADHRSWQAMKDFFTELFGA
jgi:dienelactone hydrolase